MEPISPSLGAQIAGLRKAVQAQENRAWIPDAIHTLIIACLTRIFARLESLFQAWQDGQLPPPQTTPATRTPAPRPRTPQAARRQYTPRHHAHAQKPNLPAAPRPIRAAQIWDTPRHQNTHPPGPTITPSGSARAPPFRQKRVRTASHPHAFFITISY